MRISIKGDAALTTGLKRYLEFNGYEVSNYNPFHTVYLELGRNPWITVDGIDCEFEREVINRIAELTGTQIQLSRAGGVQSQEEIRLVVPNVEKEIDAVQRGALRAIMRYTRHGFTEVHEYGERIVKIEERLTVLETAPPPPSPLPAAPPPSRPWWKVLLLLVLLTVTTPVTTPAQISSVVGTKTNNSAAPGGNNIGALVGVATAAPPAYVEGRMATLSLDLVGGLRTGVVFPASLTVVGNKSNNVAVPGATNLGVLPAVATAAPPAYTEGFQTSLSVDLAGNLRTAGGGAVTANQGAANTQVNRWPVFWSNGATERGLLADPIRIDPTGTTIQPISGTVTSSQGGAPWSIVGTKSNNTAPGATNLGTLPCIANAAEQVWTEGNQVGCSVDLSGRVRFNMSSWLGSTAPTVGQKTSANSLPVVIASDQSAVPVSGTVNVGTFPDNEPFNVAQIAGTAASVNNGTSDAGTQRVTLSSTSTGNIATIGTSVTPGTATANLGKAEDQASADGDVGVIALARRTATPANTSGLDLDYEPLQMSAGRLWTSSTIDAALPTGANTIGTVNVGTFPDNEPVNVAQINGVVPLMGNGVTGTGSQRVTIASDNTAFTVNVGTFPDNEPVNVALMNGVAVTMGAGVVGTGVQRVVLASNEALPPGTNNIGDVDVLTFPDNEPINVAQMNGVPVTMGNGVSGTGVQRSVNASDNSAIANWGHGATGAAPPTGAQQIGGTGSGATAGLMRAITVCDSYANISQITNTQVIAGVAARRIYICALNLVTATTQNVAVVAGTGAVCATATVAVPGTSGGATAATGWNFAANSGIGLGTGLGAIAQTTVDANNLCVFQSGAGQLSGGIAYAIY